MVAPPKPVQPAGAKPATPVTRSVTVQRSPNHTLADNAVDENPNKNPDKNPADKTAGQHASANQSTPQRLERSDLEDLARRLLDPVGRLLRAELRHGRERGGNLHDRRR